MPENVAVIASVLKPVDDTRLFEKLGLSISQTNKYQVNIIGFATKKLPSPPGMTFHVLFSKSRLHPSRLLAPWRFLGILMKLRPRLLIVSTPELLLPALLYKLLRKGTLWYDMQENYRLNIRYQSVYPTAIKQLLMGLVIAVEGLARPFIDQYLLAEAGYLQELRFPVGKYTVLENKFKPLALPALKSRSGITKFVFSGTVAVEQGILQAIKLVGDLHRLGHAVRLTVIGHIPDQALRKTLEARAAGQAQDFLEIIGGAHPLPHASILEQLQQADFGLLAHQPNLSNRHCIPTRIYEFLGLGIPFVLQKHPLWEAVAAPYQAAWAIDFNDYRAHEVWQALQSKRFYTCKPGPEVLWSSQEAKLRALLQQVP